MQRVKIAHSFFTDCVKTVPRYHLGTDKFFLSRGGGGVSFLGLAGNFFQKNNAVSNNFFHCIWQ